MKDTQWLPSASDQEDSLQQCDKYDPEKEEAISLLEELMRHISCSNFDMGGQHTYSLNFEGFKVIDKIRNFLYRICE